jgi:DNA (cytosine-5)-methyltransferase 1
MAKLERVFPSPSETFRFIDLFAGIGGFHHAMSSLGGECQLAVEIDREAQVVYASTFPDTPLVGDIRSITLDEDGNDHTLDEIAERVPDHDVLCAGFPCQPFSKSGFQEGVRDRTRGTLFFDIMTIVDAKQPKYLVLENVRNLAGPRHEDTWSTIVESIRNLGYRVADEPVVFSPHLLPPELGGAPQVRDRVFILAEKIDGGTEDDRIGEKLVEREAVGDWSPDRWDVETILDDDEGIDEIERYQLRPEEQGWIEAWQSFVQRIPSESLPGFPIWVDSFDVEARIPPGTPRWKKDFLIKNASFYVEHKPVIDEWLTQRWGPLQQAVAEFPPSRRKFEWQARSVQPKRADRDLTKLVLHLRPSGIRVKAATYLPALVAITQTSIVGSRMRRITPREAARLQGIPDDVFEKAGVTDKAAYKQLGNAVNVGAVAFVARELFESDHRIDVALHAAN